MLVHLAFAFVIAVMVAVPVSAQQIPRWDLEALKPECGQSQDCLNRLQALIALEKITIDKAFGSVRPPFSVTAQRIQKLRDATIDFMNHYPDVWHKVRFMRTA